jgi:hypothetical protein
MRLTGWTWLIFGGIITMMSGYIYLFVPKNGKPNTAMALFFFIGIVFIVIGIVKVFFKRADDKSIFDSVNESAQKNPEKIIQIPVIENKPNRIDDAIGQMMQQEQSRTVTQQSAPRTPMVQHQQPAHAVHNTSHTNTYSQLHQYKGPVHTPSTGVHAQHPVAQHIQNSPTHVTPQHQTHHPVQNATEHSIKCGKCGNANSGHSNYCHKCGGRLK